MNKNNCRLGIFIYGVIKQLFDVKRWSSIQGSELIRSTCVLMICDSVLYELLDEFSHETKGMLMH